MNNSENKEQDMPDRARIISTVQTPLGFFTLVVLVVEAILGIIAGLSDSPTQDIALYGMIALIAALVFVVAFMAYKRPEALKGVRPTIDKLIDVGTQSNESDTGKKFAISQLERSSILRHNATIHLLCDCELTDLLYLSQDKTFVPIADENQWSYQNSNCNLFLNHRTEKAFLEFDAEIKDDDHYISPFKFTASGTFDGAMAYLEYCLTEKERKNRTWKGLTILRIPKSGIIYGNWMTTGILSHARIGVGSIQLRRKC